MKQLFLKHPESLFKIFFLTSLFLGNILYAQSQPVLELNTTSYANDAGIVTGYLEAAFLRNTDNPTGITFAAHTPELKIKFSISNQQYRSSTRNAVVNIGQGDDPSTTTGIDPFTTISAGASNAADTNFSSSLSTAGTGIAVGINHGVNIYTNVMPLQTAGLLNTGKYYVANLKVSFSRPVDNPILHFAGLGDAVGGTGGTYANSTEYEFTGSNITPTLSRLSGSATFSLSGNNILNSASYATMTSIPDGSAHGSILFTGKGITELNFKVYMRGTTGNPGGTNSTSWNGGTSFGSPDRNIISASVAETDMQITKTASNYAPNTGDTVTFTIVATNNGASNNTNVIVNDLLKSGYSYISHVAPVGTTYNPTTGVWTIGSMASNSNQTLTINAKVNRNGDFANTATISGDLGDPLPSNNTATIYTRRVKKEAVDAAGAAITTVKPNDQIIYVVETSLITDDTVPAAQVRLNDTADAFQSYLSGSLKIPQGWTAGTPTGILDGDLMASFTQQIYPYFGNAVPIYGSNGYGAALDVKPNLTFSATGAGDGYIPITINMPNGHQGVVVASHHQGTFLNSTTASSSILCLDANNNGANCIGSGYTTNVPFVNTAHSYYLTKYETGGTYRFFIPGTFDPGVVGNSGEKPALGCLDYSDNSIRPCSTRRIQLDTTTRDTNNILGAFTVADKVCTAWGSNESNINYVNLGCINPVTLVAYAVEKIRVNPNGTTASAINIASNVSPGDVAFALNGNKVVLSFSQNYALSASPFTASALSQIVCLDIQNGTTATKDCSGSSTISPITMGTTTAKLGFIPRLDATTGTINGFCHFGTINGAVATATNQRPCYDLTGSLATSPQTTQIPSTWPDNPKIWHNFSLVQGKPYIIYGRYSQSFQPNCFNWATLGNCTTQVVSEDNMYGTTTIKASAGAICQVTYGHTNQWKIFAIDKNGTEGTFTEDCVINDTAGTVQTITVPDPSTNYCDPLTTVIGWTNIVMTNVPKQSGSKINIKDLNGNVIAILDVPVTLIDKQKLTIDISSVVNYATYPSFKVEFPFWQVDSADGTDMTATINYSTNTGAKPQVCYATTVTGCNATPNNKTTNTVTASGGVTATAQLSILGGFLTCNGYCYKNPVTVTDGSDLSAKIGITSLGRAGESSNWPMVRKGAWLALEGKTKGFVVNRVSFTGGNPDGIPAANFVKGMMVYDTTNNCLKIYNGSIWSCYTTQTCPD